MHGNRISAFVNTDALLRAVSGSGVVPPQPSEIVSTGSAIRFGGGLLLIADDGLAAVWSASGKDGTWAAAGVSDRKSGPAIKALRAQMASAQEQDRLAKIAEVRTLWDSGTECSGHDFLTAKHIGAGSTRISADGKTLLVPAHDNAGEIQAVLRIFRDSDEAFQERFLGAAAGARLVIGDLQPSDPVVLVAYDFATGMTLNEATTLPVVVVFNGWNLAATITDYRQHIVIACPDTTIAGKQQAHLAIKAIPQGHVLVPKLTAGATFNDAVVMRENIGTGISVHDQVMPVAELLREEGADAILLEDLGIEPMGVDDNGKPQIFFRPTRKIMTLSSRADSMHLLGPRVLERLMTKVNPKSDDDDGKAVQPIVGAFFRILVACQNPKRTVVKKRGEGFWLDSDGKLLFHDGMSYRKHDGYSYMPSAEGYVVPIHASRDEVTREIRLLLQELEVRYGKHVAVATLAFVVQAFAAGALDWVAHFWLTGESGAGKTFLLHKVIAVILGNAALQGMGASSACGFRNGLMDSAKALLVNESEPTSENLSKLLTMMKSGTEGDYDRKATNDGGRHNYFVKTCVALASIASVTDDQGDNSRIIPVTITGSDYISERLADRKWLRRLGQLIVGRLIDDFEGLQKSIAIAEAQECKKGNSRRGQTMGVIHGCARWIAGDDALQLDEAVVERRFTEKDYTRWIARILAIQTDCVTENGKIKRTIGDQLGDGIKPDIGALGMLYQRKTKTLYISSTSAALAKALGCKDGHWFDHLKGIPGAVPKSGTVNRAPAYGVAIPLVSILSDDDSDDAVTQDPLPANVAKLPPASRPPAPKPAPGSGVTAPAPAASVIVTATPAPIQSTAFAVASPPPDAVPITVIERPRELRLSELARQSH